MVGTILLFELRQRLRRISTYVYFLVFLALGFFFMLLAGGAIPSASLDFGTGGKVLVNSPYALNSIISYTCLFGLVVTAALAGQATYQDVDNDCTGFLYSAPITKFDYLAGRFLGCLAVQLLIFPSVGLGAWMGAHMRWLDATRLGPERLAGYLQPYLVFVLPNLLFTSAIFFAVAALGRKMLPVYAGSILLLMGYFVAAQLSTSVNVSVAAALVDPFGGNAMDRLTQYWTPFERNTHLLSFTGTLLLNRVLWTCIGAAIFAFTYAHFSFSRPTQLRQRPLGETEEDFAAPTAGALPSVRLDFSLSASARQFFSLTRLQFTETVKNVFFAVLVLAGALFGLIAVSGVTNPFATPIYPVTYRMLELGSGGFAVFALAIITFYAGELVWRERDARGNQIVDALPVQRWVLFGSKLAALMLVQVLLVLVILAVGVAAQIAHGYYRFELGLYFLELFGNRLIGYWILCVFALFVHTLVNQKYLGHFLLVLYYLATIALPPMGFQHYLYRFGQVPLYIYSDMNGYGPFVSPLVWFRIYWSSAVVVLAILTNLLWVRGIDAGWRERFRIGVARLSRPARFGLTASGLLFIGVGGYIFYNTNILNSYRTTFQNEEQRAQYEKKYRQYASLPEPKLLSVNTEIDLEPEKRLAAVRGTMSLVNRTDRPIDRVALTLWPVDLAPLPRPHIEIERLSFTGGQAPVIEDPALGFYLYRLLTPLPPQGRMALEFSLRYPNLGFVNSRPNTDLVRNGSFLNNSYGPFLGYFQDVELSDDGVRHRHGLQKTKRLAKLEDLAARQNNYVTATFDWTDFEGVVSTSPDQIAILPGYLDKEWLEGGRRHFHYKMDVPILGIESVNSARYAVRRDRWHDVNLEIYYQPGHEFNLERMNRGMKATLDYCTAAFSPYQFRQVRIIEFPRYDTFAESFPNTIPFSESIGFITRVDPNKPDAIDLPFYVTAHEVAHQWWGHQVVSSNVEGATSIVESLAQYTALMVMQHTYGPQSMKKFLRYELDGYLRGRGQERNEEKPLARVEPNQGYIHYNKGGLVMYALQDYIGEDAVNRALAAFVRAYAFKGPPYPVSTDMVGYLRNSTPPDLEYLYDDLFDNITFYDNRAGSAAFTRRPDGRYDVQLSIEAKKYRADGRGQEHPVPLHDQIDLGVLDAQGRYLYLRKWLIDRPEMDFTLTVDQPPARAGIDPLNKLIDRKPDDNTVEVKKR